MLKYFFNVNVMRNFKHWRRQQIANTFGLKQKQQCDDLDNWLNSNEDIPTDIKPDLIRLQQKLRRNILTWNEQEMMVKFISLIMDKVNYDNALFGLFANRTLTSEIDGKTVSGEVDMIIGSGKYGLQTPYFCLSQCKIGEAEDYDPLGELIIAMMTAQSISNQETMYGVYILERNWFFLTLKNREYCISDSYIASRESDIFTIFKILKKLKGIVGELAAEAV